MSAVLTPTVLYEDNHLIVINKPAGMLSQGDTTGDESAFEWTKEYIRSTYAKPGNVYLALLHRTDRPVGGVLLLAKTSKAAARMTEQFKTREIHKTYLAVVERVPDADSGRLRHFLGKLPGKNIVRAYDKPAYGAQEAILDWQLLQTAGSRALLAVNPITGRQHQIRVQLARMGCTIAGDVKYGKTKFLPDGNIALFAWRVDLIHPVTKAPLRVEAPMPSGEPWNAFDPSRLATAADTQPNTQSAEPHA